MRDYLNFYIHGAWVDPVESRTLDVENPVTERACGRIALGGSADVDHAVQAARRAFPAWSTSSAADRLELLAALAGDYRKRSADLAEAVSEEMGAPPALAAGPQVRRIRSGTVAINHALDIAAPFGGYKQSGNGREWGEFGLHEFLETKGIVGYSPNCAGPDGGA